MHILRKDFGFAPGWNVRNPGDPPTTAADGIGATLARLHRELSGSIRTTRHRRLFDCAAGAVAIAACCLLCFVLMRVMPVCTAADGPPPWTIGTVVKTAGC